MALVIEDGSRVTGANSYCSVETARAYAAARGRTFPAHTTEGDAAAEVLLIRATDFIESLRGRFQGLRVSNDQALQWPRSGVMVDEFYLDQGEIPPCLIQAQAQLAIEAQTQELMKTGDGKEVIFQSVANAVEVHFQPTGNTSPQPVFVAVMALLAPLLNGGSSRLGGLRTVRV